MNKSRTMIVALAIALVALAGCSTEYYNYQGGNRTFVGTGGASKMVDGVEMWITGSPPRKYQIVGYISDSRPGGIISMAQRDSAVAAEAHAKGGDGVIMNSDDSQYMGTLSTANVSFVGRSAFGTGTNVPMYRRTGTYYVIKYVN